MEKIEKLQKIFDECSNIVFFGGAGVSTDSGIPDFRSQDGLYNQQYDYPPEYMLSVDCFFKQPKDFFKFYNDKILCCLSAKPNFTHYFLAEAEKKGKLRSVITQNIDGLHQKAGSKTVRELHGTVMKNYCVKCHTFYDVDYIRDQYPPICECEREIEHGGIITCEGIIKPDVVLYGETLNMQTVSDAVNDIENADALIIGGTSLVVHPACDLVDAFKGKYLVVINKETTPQDDIANLVFHEKLNDVLKQIKL